MKTVTKLSILTALVLTFLVSCNPNGAGIFYSISTEVKIKESDLSDKAIYKIVYSGSNLYVLAGRAVYYGDGSIWTKIAAPSGKPYAVSLAVAGSKILAVYEDDSVSPLADSLYFLDSTTWKEDANASDFQGSPGIELITVDHDPNIVFISQMTDTGTYHIYSYDGSTLTSLTSTSTDISLPLVGAGILGSTYYLAASEASESTGSSYLYSTDGTLSNWSDITSSDNFPSSKTIGGISEDSGTATLYLSTKDGYLYSRTDGTAWTQNTTHLTDTAGNDAQLGDMAEVNFNSVNYLIIAGNTGYYEWNLSSGTPGTPTVTAIDFSTYDLSNEMVFSVFTDDVNLTNKIYLGSAQGLWESLYSNGAVTLNQK